jgi:hypothetical protein
MFCDHFHCGVGRVEGAVVDRSRNDGGMGGMRRKRGEKEKVCQFLTQMDGTKISPHRMYEMYMLGNICFFSDIIWTDTFASWCLFWVHSMCWKASAIWSR